MLHLTESDLRFLVETVATSRRDYDRVMDLVRGKEDLLELSKLIPRTVPRMINAVATDKIEALTKALFSSTR